MKSISKTLLFALCYCFFTHFLAKSNPDSTHKGYILSCGASEDAATDADGRKWGPDAKFLTSSRDTEAATAQYQDPSLPTVVPYMTARIFKSSSTSYKFPVTPNTRHWLRLYFYPSTYNGLDPFTSYFSVVANGVTLLHNFSGAITAKAFTQGYIIREFCLTPVGSGDLNVTITPAKGSYAYVNGIELVPMPDIFQKPAIFLGFSDQYLELTSCTLQTMFRLNVGGQFIPPNKDSGLTRTWYDDFPYLFGSGIGVTSRADKNLSIQYSKSVPEVIAPVDVYSTGRTMGPSARVNANYNLTWIFQVDANFTYVVRLHFCEYEVNKINERVFDIYINNQTAQSPSDIIAWVGGQGRPIYKDFAAYVSDSPGDEEMWVQLHPTVSMKPKHLNALLNGLEIFKMNDSNMNLAGPNPVPSQMLTDAEAEAESKRFSESEARNGPLIAGGVAGGVASCALVVAIVVVVVVKKKKKTGKILSSVITYGSSHSSSTGKTFPGSQISNLAAGLCRHFSLSEIKHGTKNFDESRVIGVGGFGNVYRGTIDGGTKVAIKRSNPSSEQGVHEFQTEIEMLSKLRHRHLVSLIGFCEEGGEMILVYDYMANGTLREHLYKTNKPPLPWKQRLEICIGAARGLHYLHTGARHTIIHRDVKTTNILLDEKWVAKVSDFGLSKTGPNLEQDHVSTMVKGSFGYLDPEYFRRQQLTEKSDVYSFGVVLFEVLCARPVLDASLPKEQVSLGDYARICERKGTLHEIIDPHLKGRINPECLRKFTEIAGKCLLDHGTDRPSMGDVLWNLEFSLQLEEHPGGMLVAENKANNAYATHTATIAADEAIVNDDVDSNRSAVFSQLVDLKGR
ncbi:hypothetical protein E1A91_D02G073400v1 [Gossypium mustelinum]|uniref:non-specific serine/threonine protein kinase n=2 Tax=Gossypium TaxID=3633 RepID=A0A5D2VTX8_GOSMU|nr:hypothetical protein E1A91_D02G073400v1 [Gossypium mustelinum]